MARGPLSLLLAVREERDGPLVGILIVLTFLTGAVLAGSSAHVDTRRDAAWVRPRRPSAT